MHSLTLKITTDAAGQLDVLAQQYIQDYIKLGKGRPVFTHMEWLSKHPDGKLFMHDCMQHKYLKLNQTELTKLSNKLYSESLSTGTQHGTVYIHTPTLKEARNAVIIELLQKAAQVYEKPVLTIIPTKYLR